MFPFGYNPYGSSYQSYDPYDQIRLQQELQRRRQAQEYARQRQLEELNRRRAAQLEYARREAELQRRREAEALRQRQMELEARRRKLSEPARPRGIGGPGYRHSMFDGGVQDLFDALYGRPRARSPSPNSPGRRSASSAPKAERARSPSAEPKSKVRFAPDDSAVSDGEEQDADVSGPKGVPIAVSTPDEPMDTTESSEQVDSSPSRKAVSDILAKFSTLRSDFTFPTKLDFLPSPDGVSTPTPKLAYTPNNAPLHQYEHLLTGLLTQLDAVESYGDAEVRKARKDAVKEIEKELEELDVKKVQDWRKQFEPPVVVEPTSEPAPEVEMTRDVSSSTEEASDPQAQAQTQASVDPASVPLPQSEDRELGMEINPEHSASTSEPIVANTTAAQDAEVSSPQPAAPAPSSENEDAHLGSTLLRPSSPSPDSNGDRTIMPKHSVPAKPAEEISIVSKPEHADTAEDDYVNVPSATMDSRVNDDDAKIKDDWELEF
ncbi:BAG domain protein [Ceratobasidium sp. AG-Ba]|nr:BAG domain protein [Ceratobasidium sp. AG-Ba]